MTDQLPYPNVPSSKRGKIRYLARVIRVEPIHLKDVPDDKAAQALVGVILFHHADTPGNGKLRS